MASSSDDGGPAATVPATVAWHRVYAEPALPQHRSPAAPPPAPAAASGSRATRGQRAQQRHVLLRYFLGY
ncbi:hypothetical protein GUJ93_ZPchr0001g31614 [Zizania palustris]|uniref:Uncharacterized protein n=1 Tax=Zizania palustris TaxID=103762 RepID=A0A8J5RPT1_ZIZPA|nr:hypothetical protein GUJ93_ZPchr0001g31614 [Zizania palustris]